MTAFLVDTNVISELVSTQKDPRVLRFVAENADLRVSTLVIHELRYGVEHMPSGRRRDDLHVSYETLFAQFENRVLPFDRASAEWAARFRIVREREGVGASIWWMPSSPEPPEPMDSPSPLKIPLIPICGILT